MEPLVFHPANPFLLPLSSSFAAMQQHSRYAVTGFDRRRDRISSILYR
jgi:hypothetical protein